MSVTPLGLRPFNVILLASVSADPTEKEGGALCVEIINTAEELFAKVCRFSSALSSTIIIIEK